MTTRDHKGNLHGRQGRFTHKGNSRPADQLREPSERAHTLDTIRLLPDYDPRGGFDVSVDAPTGRYYLREGHPHREDGPAYEGSDGTLEWRIGGELHRDSGPAVIHDDGTEEFWEHGHLVRAS
jgi:hypothetical protein